MVRESNGRSKFGTRRVRRLEATRAAILRAAGGVFRTRGFARAGMREIGVAADVSPANLYYYFRGKDELLFYCQDRALDRLLSAFDTVRRLDEPAPVRLQALAVAHVRCLLDEVDGSTAHVEVDALPPALRKRIVRKRDRYEAAVRQLVADGVRDGELRPCDPAIGTRAFLGALNWTAHWFRPDGTYSVDALAEQLAECAVAGLAAPAMRARRATAAASTPR